MEEIRRSELSPWLIRLSFEAVKLSKAHLSLSSQVLGISFSCGALTSFGEHGVKPFLLKCFLVQGQWLWNRPWVSYVQSSSSCIV